MNSRFGIFLSTVLMLAGIALWSVTVLAAEDAATEPTVRHETLDGATEAHREAAADAAARIKAESKLDLDIELVDRTSRQAASD